MFVVSLENVLLDVKELGKGMELIRRECSLHDHAVLKGFLQASDLPLDKLQKDAKTAEVTHTHILVTTLERTLHRHYYLNAMIN